MNIIKYFFTALFVLCLAVNGIAGINTWTQCSGTNGYAVDALLLDTTTMGRIYAGSYNFLMSTDFGTTWMYSSFSAVAPAGGILTIAVNPKSPNEVYIWIGDGGGIGKNTTYGYGNWTAITNDLSGAVTVPNLLIDPTNVKRMYVGSGFDGEPGDAAAYRSDDTGYHWSITTSGLNDYLYTLIMHPTLYNWLYAGAGGSPGLYVSVNGATTWNSMPFYNEIKSLSIDPMDSNKIYAGIATHGFAHSLNGGYSWSYCTDATIINYTPLAIVVNPLNPKIIYIGTQFNGVFKSKDRGNTWYAMNTGMPICPIWSLAYDTITRTLFAGTEGLVPPENIPIGIWMYQDTDLTTPPDPVDVPKDIWQLYE